jgi:3-phenylpropionate/trans-cinnamate dioxygenase ferredoxin subunit
MAATYHDVGKVSDFSVGKLTPVEVPGKDIWIFRKPDGEFMGIKNTCPHQGAPLCMGAIDGTFVPSEPGQFTFGMEYRVIRCPNHGWEFDVETGHEAFMRSNYRIVRYDVRVDDGRVLVSNRGK